VAIARKLDRIADADQDWEDIKEILEDPNLSPTQRKGYLNLKSKLRREVAEERGELPVRAQLELETGPRLQHSVIGWDIEKWAQQAAGNPGAPASNDHHEPPRSIAPTPVPTPPPEPVPEIPDYVEQAAKTLAMKVWSEKSISRDRLFGARPFAGIHPDTAEEYLNHAIDMQWVTVDGDQIARGAVNPQPAPTPVVAPEPASAPVSEEVERAAKSVAVQVRSFGPSSREQLFNGLNPDIAEQYLDHTVAMGWVTLNGGLIVAGPVDPRPPEDVASTQSSRARLHFLG
jgi:hypothetical protein